MRIKHTLMLAIADDSDMKDPLFGQIDETLALVVIDGYTGQASGKFKVEVDDSKVLSMGDITAVKGVYLELDQDCSIKINDGAAIAVKRGNTATGSLAKFFLEAVITKIEVVVALGGVETHGTYCVWGDPSS